MPLRWWSAVGLAPSRASGTETKWRCRYMPAGATRPRPPAPIKNQQAISLRFFPEPYGSACVQHAEPSLAETRCIANKLLYRKISHCLVHSHLFFKNSARQGKKVSLDNFLLNLSRKNRHSSLLSAALRRWLYTASTAAC